MRYFFDKLIFSFAIPLQYHCKRERIDTSIVCSGSVNSRLQTCLNSRLQYPPKGGLHCKGRMAFCKGEDYRTLIDNTFFLERKK